MRRLTIVVIPDDAKVTRQVVVPSIFFRIIPLAVIIICSFSGYFVLDYLELRKIRDSYEKVATENDVIKGEAQVLMANLEEVKQSLRRVRDYTGQLMELTTSKVQKVRKETGLGPMAAEDYKNGKNLSGNVGKAASYMPAGIDVDKLTFRPVFDRLATIGDEAGRNALELQHLLSNLNQQKSLLQSIPSIIPVDGWITSSFGKRVSPFTGEKSVHMGIDIASNIGSPILAPADGIVIFTGTKEGFGNFVMVAHGYGIVSHYGHTAQVLVQPGQAVRRGDQIATVGMTGRTTGPHVHYEVWLNGNAVDPRKFLLDGSDFELAAH